MKLHRYDDPERYEISHVKYNYSIRGTAIYQSYSEELGFNAITENYLVCYDQDKNIYVDFPLVLTGVYL